MAEADRQGIVRNVGRRIAELRRGSERTQEKLAEEMGISVSYLRRVETGRENLTILSLAKFAEMLDVAIASLFDEAIEPEIRVGRPPKGS